MSLSTVNTHNIRFTFEKEINHVISFLDVLIKVTPFSYDLTTYYKKTYTGLTSFTPFRYKTGLIRTLIDRAYKINSSYLNLHKNFIKIRSTLQKNAFPSYLIDKYIMKCLDLKFSPSPEKEAPESPRFYKLPFIGDYSNSISRQVSKLIRKYCKEGTNIRLIFIELEIA